jgi:hypothetical protein
MILTIEILSMPGTIFSLLMCSSYCTCSFKQLHSSLRDNHRNRSREPDELSSFSSFISSELCLDLVQSDRGIDLHDCHLLATNKGMLPIVMTYISKVPSKSS